MRDPVFTVHKSAEDVNSLASCIVHLEGLEEGLESFECRYHGLRMGCLPSHDEVSAWLVIVEDFRR